MGGPGSGGAINLVAPTILGASSLVVTSGTPYGGGKNYNGIIRISISTNTNSFTGNANGGIILGPLYLPPPNCTLTTPNLRVTQVYGVNVPTNPGGQYLYPDVIVAASGSFSISIATSTATCTAALPFSVSVGAIRANW